MLWRVRSFWPSAAVLLYVCAAALRAAPTARATWIGLLLGPACLVWGWKLVAPPLKGVDHVEPTARSAARAVMTGAALSLVAWLAPDGPSFDLVLHAATAMACVASLVALARVSSLGGVAAGAPRGGLYAALAALLLWLPAVGLAATRAAADDPGAAPSVGQDFGVVVGALGSLLITLVAAFRLFATRRFELGVAERAAAALWLGVLSLVIGVFTALLSMVAPEAIVPPTALLASLGTTAAAVAQRPARVSRVLRVAVSVALLSAPLVCVGVVAAYKLPTHAGMIVFLVTMAAATAGLGATRMARRLAPERGRWLRVLDEAIVGAKQPDPHEAVGSALRAIQGGLGQDAGRAAFYRLGSRDRAVVDRAGYLQSEKAEVPGRLVEIASEQPDRVLSTEALRYVRVQQPEVRPLVSWLDERDAGAVALVLDDEVCVGMLLWPAAGRGSPLTIDEVRGLRQLTDHLGIAAGAASQLARARSRELDAEDAIARARSEVQRLEDRFERDAARRRALSERLARAVEVASYSPAAQSARLEMERIAAAGLPIAMVLPPGVDGETWAAAAHMASPRADGNLLLVQCSDEREQALELWKDATRSPTVLAREGTLVLIHPELLPLETQRYIGSGLREDMGLVVLLPANLEVLLEAGELDPHLAARFGARQLVLPDLASRAEDLRALAMHMLGPIGISLRGEGMGLSLQAQQLLNEHHWPGNEAELRSVLWRAALATRGLRVEADALAAAMGDGELHRSGPQKAAQR